MKSRKGLLDKSSADRIVHGVTVSSKKFDRQSPKDGVIKKSALELARLSYALELQLGAISSALSAPTNGKEDVRCREFTRAQNQKSRKKASQFADTPKSAGRNCIARILGVAPSRATCTAILLVEVLACIKLARSLRLFAQSSTSTAPRRKLHA